MFNRKLPTVSQRIEVLHSGLNQGTGTYSATLDDDSIPNRNIQIEGPVNWNDSSRQSDRHETDV